MLINNGWMITLDDLLTWLDCDPLLHQPRWYSLAPIACAMCWVDDYPERIQPTKVINSNWRILIMDNQEGSSNQISWWIKQIWTNPWLSMIWFCWLDYCDLPRSIGHLADSNSYEDCWFWQSTVSGGTMACWTAVGLVLFQGIRSGTSKGEEPPNCWPTFISFPHRLSRYQVGLS